MIKQNYKKIVLLYLLYYSICNIIGFRPTFYFVRYLNFWDYKKFSGTKSGPLTHAWAGKGRKEEKYIIDF